MCPDARRTRKTRTKSYDTAETASVTPPARQELRGKPRQPAASRALSGDWALNPRLGFLLLVGVGVATSRMAHPLRLSLLWLVLLALVLLYAQKQPLKSEYSLLNVARGALVGTIIALPFYLFAKDFFYATASWLYGVTDLQVLLERAVFLVPILEGTFFRGIVQRERGLVEGALLFGLAQALYFVSAVNIYPAVIAAMMVGMAMVGLLYGYMYKRYGLTASISCHVAVNLVLFMMPALAAQLGRWLV